MKYLNIFLSPSLRVLTELMVHSDQKMWQTKYKIIIIKNKHEMTSNHIIPLDFKWIVGLTDYLKLQEILQVMTDVSDVSFLPKKDWEGCFGERSRVPGYYFALNKAKLQTNQTVIRKYVYTLSSDGDGYDNSLKKKKMSLNSLLHATVVYLS